MYDDHESSSRPNSVRSWHRRLSDRARRRDREQVEAEVLADLRYQFRSACVGTALARMIYTPSGVTMSVPKIGQISLGPPVTMLVQARFGQTVDDFAAAAPKIAAALNVAGITVTPHVERWVRIVLLSDPPGLAGRAG